VAKPDEPSPAPEPSALERFLGIFTQVKGGEGLSAVLMTCNVFLLLTAYYVIKPIRDSMMAVMAGGPQYKSYLSALIVVALLGAVPAYARVARALPRNRLVVGVTLFFVSNLVLFAVAMANDDVRTATLPLGPLATVMPTDSLEIMPVLFFLWVGIFNMMVVAQFWAFGNDIYTEEQGKRLFPMLGIGASIGAVLGTGVVAAMASALASFQLFAISAALLAVCALLTQVVHVRESRARPSAPVRSSVEERQPSASGPRADAPKQGAFQMVRRHRYLTYLAAFSLVFTLVNTNGVFMLDTAVSQWVSDAVGSQDTFETPAARDEFESQMGNAAYGNFYFYQNLLSALLQMFIVSRLVRYAGFGRSFFILPVIGLIGYTAMALVPVLAVVRMGKVVENATDYSVNNTLRQMLWLPTTTAMKYQAKQAVDTFFVRMGDVGSAVMVAVLAGALGLGLRTFAVANLLCREDRDGVAPAEENGSRRI